MEEGAPAEGRFHESEGHHPWLDAVWEYDAGDAVSAVIPADGCVDLILRLGATRDVQALVHPPSVSAHPTCIDAGERIVGMRLRAGFGGPLLAQSDLVARVVNERFRHDVDLVAFEALAGELLNDIGRPPAILLDFLDFVTESRGTARLGEAQYQDGRERRLQRVARQWLGMSPKAFMRIERACAACDAIRSGELLAAVAADFGYADQAHLSREFRALLGVTPRSVQPVGILQDRGVHRR